MSKFKAAMNPNMEDFMTREEISILSLKLLSLYAFITALEYLPDIIYYVSENSKMDELLTILSFFSILLPGLLLTLCGLLLWYQAPLLTNAIFKQNKQSYNTGASLFDIQMIAFSIIGLFIIATVFPDFIKIVLVQLISFPVEGRNEALIPDIVALIIKLIMGFWLLFDSRRIVTKLQK